MQGPFSDDISAVNWKLGMVLVIFLNSCWIVLNYPAIGLCCSCLESGKVYASIGYCNVAVQGYATLQG